MQQAFKTPTKYIYDVLFGFVTLKSNVKYNVNTFKYNSWKYI